MSKTNTDPAELDEAASLRFNILCDSLDIERPAFPLETGDVVRLMQALGYRTSADDVLHLLTLGAPCPQSVNGKRRWRPFDAAQLAAILESRRRWALHPHHLHKMSNVERIQLEREAIGESSAFYDAEAFDVEQLLLLMEGAEQSAVRHACRIAIQEKLKTGEGL